MKNNTVLGKKESLFFIISISIISILFITNFIINFSDFSNLINLLLLDDPTMYIKNFNTYKVVLIFILILCLISFVLSFVFLAIRNKTAKSVILIINITLLALIFAFYFVIKFSNGNSASLYAMGNFDDYSTFSYNDYLISTGSSLLISSFISIVTSVISFNISNQFFRKSEENKHKSEENKTVAELDLESGIEKLKSQIRIKNLEKEYIKLKNELDND